ncbi:substrate-binding domain-containing protein [Pontibacter sp. JAM-7]|uniref:substrate-binding domain-containing protein n=1 Tax=Pontibacter sp. JAM-7 TaxID=3366581 RepID=UPI003AF630B5
MIITCVIANTSYAARIAYISPDLSIPFWQSMAEGLQLQAQASGHEVLLFDSQNSARLELENTVQALRSELAALVISPTTSSTAVTLLRLAKNAGVPVVIADIGTEQGEYLSFIKSGNYQGGYTLGTILADAMHASNIAAGRVGVIAIPQTRLNGRERTAGFVQALKYADIKMAGIRQQKTFSYNETYRYAKELIRNFADLRALWLQGGKHYKAVLQAVEESGRREKILLICFDALPEFLPLIADGTLLASALQQPKLMGETAVRVIDDYLRGVPVSAEIEVPVLTITTDNLNQIKDNLLENAPSVDHD